MKMTDVLRRLLPSGLVLSLSLLVASAAEPPPLPPQPPAAPQGAPATPRIVSRPIRLRTNQVVGTGAASVQGAVVRPQSAPTLAITPTVNNPDALAWDSKLKEYAAKAGETEAKFTFALTNVSKETVTIQSVHTSCGCTAAKLPQQPWVIAPGERGEIGVTVDLRNKYGTITKTATINSSVGPVPLTVRCIIPAPDLNAARTGDRTRNMQIAAADRQSVFRGDCATCHVAPTLGKTGKALYETACGICHEGEHRASMVPSLRALNKPTDRAYWTQWITSGREGSLMPAFSLKQGGILSDDQVGSLVEYLGGEFALEVKLPGGGAVPDAGTKAKAPPLAP